MPKPRRVPYVVVEATIRRNSKLVDLPNDSARLGYIYVLLGEAKLIRPQGRFHSRGHFDEIAGRFARYYAAYLRAGLLELAPELCEACHEDWPGLEVGSLVVHNYRRIQSDPWSAERARGWRGDRSDTEPTAFDPAGMNGDQTVIERSLNDHGTADERESSGSRDSRERASRQRDRETSSTTPQPPASGGRKPRARDLGPMRPPGGYDYRTISDATPADELPDWLRGTAPVGDTA